jgi:hypothetical protein
VTDSQIIAKGLEEERCKEMNQGWDIQGRWDPPFDVFAVRPEPRTRSNSRCDIGNSSLREESTSHHTEEIPDISPPGTDRQL